MGCEGLELHILHRPYMDSIDLDPQPILGLGSDKLVAYFERLPRNLLEIRNIYESTRVINEKGQISFD